MLDDNAPLAALFFQYISMEDSVLEHQLQIKVQQQNPIWPNCQKTQAGPEIGVELGLLHSLANVFLCYLLLHPTLFLIDRVGADGADYFS